MYCNKSESSVISFVNIDLVSPIVNIPGLSPDKSKFCASSFVDKRASAFRTSARTPSKSKHPFLPSHLLTNCWTPLTLFSDNPSIYSNQLCKAQHVNQTYSTKSTPKIRMPLFKILHLPFRIPNVHSTYLPIDSNYLDQWISLMLLVAPKGGTVHYQFK